MRSFVIKAVHLLGGRGFCALPQAQESGFRSASFLHIVRWGRSVHFRAGNAGGKRPAGDEAGMASGL